MVCFYMHVFSKMVIYVVHIQLWRFIARDFDELSVVYGAPDIS